MNKNRQLFPWDLLQEYTQSSQWRHRQTHGFPRFPGWKIRQSGL